MYKLPLTEAAGNISFGADKGIFTVDDITDIFVYVNIDEEHLVLYSRIKIARAAFVWKK